MATLLFTGGTGYIGSHTAVDFLEAGHEVIILDNLSNSSSLVIDRITTITGKSPIFYEGDMRDDALLEKIFSTHAIDTVIHFAGLKAVGESCIFPERYYDVNITGSLTLFRVMESHQVRNIVFSSSATVYAPENPLPRTEDGILATSSPYGTTKLVIEQILSDYAREKNWHIVNLRYFNPIGAHHSGLIGENPRGIPNNLLPFVMQVVAGQRDTVHIFGGDYDTPDGTCIRDYIHVMDLARGHLSAYDYIHTHQGAGYALSLNLGTGRGTSVLEIISITSDVVGRKIPYTIVDRRSGDIPEMYCDPRRALELLSWSTEYDVRRAIEDSVRYIEYETKNIFP